MEKVIVRDFLKEARIDAEVEVSGWAKNIATKNCFIIWSLSFWYDRSFHFQLVKFITHSLKVLPQVQG